MVDRRAKRAENRASGLIVTDICGSFVLVFKVTLGSYGALVTKWPGTQKWLAIGQNGVKFGTRRH